MLRTLQYRLSIIRIRHLVGLIEAALAWAVGVGPKTDIPTGAMEHMETVLRINHQLFAVACLVCGLGLMFSHLKGQWYALLTIPLGFYVWVAYLRVSSVGINNYASTVLYIGLYLIILLDIARSET